MGTWGSGSFENDAAADWLDELLDRDSPGFLTETLQIAKTEYLEAPEGEAVVAASEVVLALGGKPSNHLPDELQAWIAGQPKDSVGEFRSICLAALGRVLDANSELFELWSEAGDDDLQAWRANVESLRRRVSELPAPSTSPPATDAETSQPRSKKPWWKFWA